MRSITRAAAAAIAALVAGSPAWAQAPAPPGDGSLFFNPAAGQWAHRAGGIAWLCAQGGSCTQIRFERVTPAQIAAAEIGALGFAEGSYYLSLRHADVVGGQQQAFRCVADSCQPSEMAPGQFAFLGTYDVMLQGRPTGRTAILARSANGADPARLMWCSERSCTEQALTRDNRSDYAPMGMGVADGRARVWLRERSGAVFACGAAAGNADRFDCENTGLNFPDAGAAPVAGEFDPQAVLTAIEEALRGGNIGEAERLLSEGRARFPDRPEWAQLDQRLAALRSERDNRGRFDQARRMIADARRYAGAGDYGAAEAMLIEAGRIAPGLPDIAQARADIQRLRAERFQRLQQRSQFVQAIEDAIRSFRLWEAEGLVAEALRRFPNDPDFRNFQSRVRQQRAQAEWQGRMRQASQFVASARDAMNRLQFADAERLLDQAEALAMGLPEIRTARSDLARLRIEADVRAAEIRLLSADINAALARNQLVLAERILAFAVGRHPLHFGWADFRRRIDAAKAVAPPPIPTANVLASARGAMARKDWATAERLVAQAERSDAANPDVRRARADLTAARDAAGRQAQNFIDTARTAMSRRDWTTAESAVAAAELADPQNPAVLQVRRDLNAARGSAAGPALAFVNAARAAMATKDWASAERAVAQAEAADPSNAAVRQVRADLTAERNKAAAQALAFINGARGAFAAKDWAAVERAVQQAEQADPQNPDVRQARSQLNTARTNAAAQANGFIAAARAAMLRRDWPAADAALASAEGADPTNPAVRQLKIDLAAAKAAPPPPPNTAPLVADARNAMLRKDWAAAEGFVARAEAADPSNAAVRQVRADLTAERNKAAAQANGFIATARAAMLRRDWPAADAALASAEGADPTNPAVRQLKIDLAAAKAAPPPPPNTAPLVADARNAMLRKDWAAAEGFVARAEAADPSNAAVRQVRADLTAERNKAAAQANGFIATARDAMTRRDWPAADAALASARAADPTNPAVLKLQTDLAAAKAAPPPPNAAPFIAAAQAAIKRRDWADADLQIAKAAALDPKAAADARADLTKARTAAAAQAKVLIDDAATAARTRKDWPAADRLLAQADRADPKSATVATAKTQLATARNTVATQAQPFVDATRAAIASKNEAAAKGNLARAEAIDPFGDEVRRAKAQVKAAWP